MRCLRAVTRRRPGSAHLKHEQITIQIIGTFGKDLTVFIMSELELQSESSAQTVEVQQQLPQQKPLVLTIRPTGYPDHTNVITIHSTVDGIRIKQLLSILKEEHGISNCQLLIGKRDLCNHDMRWNEALTINCINRDVLYTLNVDWVCFDRSYTIPVVKDDKIRFAIFKVPFMDSSKKYRFYYNDVLLGDMNYKTKVCDVIDLSQVTDKFINIVVEMYE